MSTSKDVRVALSYSRPSAGARCDSVLILRLKAASFMDQGVSLSYLSAFPQEQEYLYPPLTFLKLEGGMVSFVYEKTRYEIIDVSPHYPG